MLGLQPFSGRSNARVAGGAAGRQERENSIRRGGSVTTEASAIVPGLVGVEFRRGKKEAAIGIVRALWIEVLAALDEDAGAIECRIGIGCPRCAQGLDYVPRHGQIHVPGI